MSSTRSRRKRSRNATAPTLDGVAFCPGTRVDSSFHSVPGCRRGDAGVGAVLLECCASPRRRRAEAPSEARSYSLSRYSLRARPPYILACKARGAPGDNGPLRATRRGAAPARPSSPSASPASWRSSRALVETSADLLQQPRALSGRLVGARGADLLAPHRDKPRLSGHVSQASRAATRCMATRSAP
jgi:hypothetical protein